MLRHLHQQIALTPLPTAALQGAALEHAIVMLPDRSPRAARIHAIRAEQKTIIALRAAVETFGAQPALLAAFNHDGALSALLPAVPACESLTASTAIDGKALLAAIDAHPLTIATEDWKSVLSGILHFAGLLSFLSAFVIGIIPAVLLYVGLVVLRRELAKEMSSGIMTYRDLAGLIGGLAAGADALENAPKVAFPKSAAEVDGYVNKLIALSRPLAPLGIGWAGNGADAELVVDDLPETTTKPLEQLGYTDHSLKELATETKKAMEDLKGATATADRAMAALGQHLGALFESDLPEAEKQQIAIGIGAFEDFMTSLTTRLAKAGRVVAGQLDKLSNYYFNPDQA